MFPLTSADSHLGCFCVLVIVNNAAANITIYILHLYYFSEESY